MAEIVNYEYINEISIEDIANSIAGDLSNGASYNIPGISSPKIDAGTSVYNYPEGGDGEGIAGRSTDVRWNSSTASVNWTDGNIYLPSGDTITISSGSAVINGNTYIYCDTTDGTVYSTTRALDSVGENKLLLCVASNSESGKKKQFQAFGCGDQSSLATGGSIASGTITANNIASGTITANNIASGTITSNLIASNTITANEIASNSIGANELNVSRLSAISANLGTITAGDISGTTVTAGNINGTAVKLNPATAGRIDFYYGGDNVGYIIGGSVDGYDAIIINCDHVGMIGGDTLDLHLAKLRIPVGSNLY